MRELSKILGVPFWKLRRQIRSHQDDPLTPVTLKLAVSPEEIAYLEEHKSEFPGVDLKQTTCARTRRRSCWPRCSAT